MKNLNLNPNKIAQKYRTLSQWVTTAARQRRCWRRCGNCKKPWTDTNTKTVSYVVDNEGQSWGLCDTCTDLYLKNP